MPAESKQAFLEAFSEFPDHTFLWKYEKPEDKIAANYSNVVDMPWFPQRDLLGKCLLAMTIEFCMFRASKTEIIYYPRRTKQVQLN
jgi:hypothetical protein